MRHFDSSYRSLVNYRWAEVTSGDSTVKGGKDAVLPKCDHVCVHLCPCAHACIQQKAAKDIFICLFFSETLTT